MKIKYSTYYNDQIQSKSILQGPKSKKLICMHGLEIKIYFYWIGIKMFDFCIHDDQI